MSGDFHDSATVQRVAAELGRSPTMAVSRAGHSGEAVSNASQLRRQGLLNRFFPNSVDRARMHSEMMMAEKESVFLGQVFEMLRQTQLANLQELANAARARVRGEMRREVSEHLSRQWNDLRDELTRQLEELTSKLEVEAARAESLTVGFSRAVVYQKIEDDITRFYTIQHQLMGSFQKLMERETNR